MAKTHRNRFHSPSPSVIEPRRPLLLNSCSFVRAASACEGVRRISLLGALVTAKAIPKDVDLLVTIDSIMDLTRLARAGRRLMGSTQSINLGADVFLADAAGSYLGRICYYRDCRPRAACRAEHCGRRQHLNDDLHVVTLQTICLPLAEGCPTPRATRSRRGDPAGPIGASAADGERRATLGQGPLPICASTPL